MGVLFGKMSTRLIVSSTVEYPTPRDVYFFLLNKLLRSGGGLVTFSDRENGDRWVQADQQDSRATLINFSYPYDREPNQVLSQLGISFPEGFSYLTWEEQVFAVFEGPRFPSPECLAELASTIDRLFTKLLGASYLYVVEGRVDSLGDRDGPTG